MTTQQIPVDRGYLNLLAHLREEKPRVKLETIQAAICHYLINLPPTQPTPAPLTTSVISSPIWRPFTLNLCLSLGNTFRVSVRQKLSELNKKERGIFDTSVSSDLTTWIVAVLDGLKDGLPLLRMTISGGLRLGLNDSQDVKLTRSLHRKVEAAAVLAFAEETDATNPLNDQWTSEFSHTGRSTADRGELSVLLAAQYFGSFSTDALSALNSASLASACLSAVEKGLASGKYLATAREDVQRKANGTVTIPARSNLERVIEALQESDCFVCIAYTCRFLARIGRDLADASYRRRSKIELWELLSSISQKLRSMSHQIEEGWRSSPLVDVGSDAQVDEASRKVTEKIWMVLKTHLFSTLMLQQAILEIILYQSPSSSALANSYSASYLTSTILNTLSSLSFVIYSLGGVAAGPAEGGTGPSFPELKKVFYMSIDILSTDAAESKAFVHGLIDDADALNGSLKSPFAHAKRSFVLSCIEQFISALDDSCIEEIVLPFCEAHLNDPSIRQTYEAAHSVMLSIFAAHAEKSAGAVPTLSNQGVKGKSPSQANEISLAIRLVPGYAQTLLENAREGGLTTPQLRLAYAALVRSASTGRNPRRAVPAVHRTSHTPRSLFGRNNSEPDEEFSGDPALAWLCIEQLLQTHAAAIGASPETRLALSLTLISLISNVGLVLLPRVLDEVQRVVDGETEPGRRRILIENVFEEILERVGDAEREIAMKWWFQRSKRWGEIGGSSPSQGSSEEKRPVQ